MCLLEVPHRLQETFLGGQISICLLKVPHRLGDTFGGGQTPIYRCKGIGLAYHLLWFFLGFISHYEPSLSINFSCAELDFGHSSIGILAIVPPPKLC